ncbi:MAG: putative quinol monooxygenase [Gammaproteobacteria bacterium]|nr:putative quinol monooxygenase [Gammaproteobacteria bacterium]
MAETLTIIARVTVDPARIDTIKQAMLDLVDATLTERGCLRYELHQVNDAPQRLVFVETWESRDAWQRHMDGDAIRRFNARIDGGIVAFELDELTPVSR